MAAELKPAAARTAAAAEALRAPDDGPTDAFDAAVQALLIGLLLLSPLAMGAVAPWARGAVFCAAAALFTLWLLQGFARGRLRVAKSWLWPLILAFFAVAFFQMAPLSPSALARLSPGTIETARQAAGSAAAPLPITLFAYGTQAEIYRLAALALVFFVAANALRAPWQVTTLLLALAAVGVFEALYGLGEQFSGSRHIFWHARTSHLEAATGTFLNKNHFAGLLAMTLTATLGLIVAWLPRKRSAPAIGKARLVAELSSPKTHRLMLLCGAAVVISLAILFSLSRAGIVCALFSLILFAACLGVSTGFRKYTLLLFLLVAAILVIAAGVGTEIVLNRMEEAASGRSASWGDRLDLSRSGLRLFRAFPLFGTGLGAFRFAFERFQSARFGDLVADFLHNDWLQLFCETGVAGGLLVVAAALLFIAETGLAAWARKDAFCRWTAFGALIAVAGMLLHSFADYNLSKITSNGLLFAALAGVAFAASRMPSEHRGPADRRRFVTIPLGPAPLRAAMALAAVSAAALLCIAPAKAGIADIEFNRFLAASRLAPPDPYFFLPLRSAPGWPAAEECLARARRLDPGNPRYPYYAALWEAAKADWLTRALAQDSARRILGPALERTSPPAFDRLVAALSGEMAAQSSPERDRLLAESERQIRLALDRLPIAADYQIFTAQILTQRAAAEPPDSSGRANAIFSDALLHADRSLWLAPAKPSVLYEAGRILLERSAQIGGPSRSDGTPQRDGGALRLAALQRLKGAIRSDPAYADQVYPLVRAVLGGAALSQVTPPSLPAYERLAQTLWEAGDWRDLLDTLDAMDALCARQEAFAAASPWTLRPQRRSSESPAAEPSPDFDGIPDARTLAEGPQGLLEARLAIAQRRCAALGILGCWDERAAAVAAYRALLRRALLPEIRESDAWRQRQRFPEAAEVLLGALWKDWANPETLLAAAELSARRAGLEGLPEAFSSPLDQLLTLVLQNERLSPAEGERVERLLSKELAPELKNPSDPFEAEFILAAAILATGRPGEAAPKLETLARRLERDPALWRQGHLVWHYLGRAREAAGDPAGAIESYRRAVVSLPAHRDSLARLAALSPGDSTAAALARLTPRVPCNVAFGGRIRFLGYDLAREAAPQDAGAGETRAAAWFITYYWQVADRVPRGYHPSAQFCDSDWQILFTDDHALSRGGEPYPTDSPRCGEVIVEKRPLQYEPAAARYLRIGVYNPRPPRPLTASMPGDAGQSLFAAPLLTRARVVALDGNARGLKAGTTP